MFSYKPPPPTLRTVFPFPRAIQILGEKVILQGAGNKAIEHACSSRAFYFSHEIS